MSAKIRQPAVARALAAVTLVVAFALGVLAVLAFSRGLTASGVVIALVAFALGRSALTSLTAVVEVTPSGLRGSSFRKAPTTIAWSSISALKDVWTVLGRAVQVTHTDAGETRKATLAAPRSNWLASERDFKDRYETLRRAASEHGDGIDVPALEWPRRRGDVLAERIVVIVFALLVAAGPLGVVALLERPWNRSWWPGRHEAVEAPGACTVIAPSALDRLVPGTGPPISESDADERTRSRCTWASEGNDRFLTLAYSVREGGPTGTGVRLAEEELARDRADFERFTSGRVGATVPLPGIAEEAVSGSSTRPSGAGGDVEVWILARRANVVVTVEYEVEGAVGPDGPRAAAADLAREAVTAVELP